jgi:hypothetical protein
VTLVPNSRISRQGPHRKWLVQTIWVGKGLIRLFMQTILISCTGSPRNAARARTKDAAGRAQKRHFGRQRLAAALCMTREDRIHLSKPTLSSVLPEIDLAHPRRDIVVDVPSPANQAFRSVRLHLPPSPNDDKRRRNPSKILVALDTSDRTYEFLHMLCRFVYLVR